MDGERKKVKKKTKIKMRTKKKKANKGREREREKLEHKPAASKFFTFTRNTYSSIIDLKLKLISGRMTDIV